MGTTEKLVLYASRRCCTQRASSCGGGVRRGSPCRDTRPQPCLTLVDVWGALAPSTPGCHSRIRFLNLARHAHPTTQKETTGSPSTQKETTESSLTEHGNAKLRKKYESSDLYGQYFTCDGSVSSFFAPSLSLPISRILPHPAQFLDSGTLKSREKLFQSVRAPKKSFGLGVATLSGRTPRGCLPN